MSSGLSGLASDFDWSSFVDQMIALESTPITRMQREQSTNSVQVSVLSNLGTKLTALQTAVNALGDADVFTGREVSSTTSSSSWSLSADAGTTVGNYKVAVTQLATSSTFKGSTGLAAGLNADSDVSGLTIANLNTNTAVTAGVFTVNGEQVTVALTDSLQDVFDAISTATGGDVTASYDSVTDSVTLSSASEITLGAANDTSNFLSVMKLSSNGTGTTTSSASLGAVSTTAKLVNANLTTTPTGDGSGDGTFEVNGVEITYNVNTDTINSIINRINDSDAGVTASFDKTTGGMVFTNDVTGNIGMTVGNDTGTLLTSLGVTGGTLTSGLNAEYTINDGDTLISTSNTLSSDTHGIDGLDLTVDTTGTQTIKVASDTDTMTGLIEDFVDAYNEVQSYIDGQTSISTSSDGTVSTSTLTNNREVQSWSTYLRRMVFSSVDGLSGSVSRLADMGIDFSSSTNQLEIEDSTALTAALRDHADDVAALFQTSSTGLVDQLDDYIANINDYNEGLQDRLNASNDDLDVQIAAFERHLEARRSAMESAFIAMESAQSTISNQMTVLTNAFFSDSSSSS